MRVLVSGSRDWNDQERIERDLDALLGRCLANNEDITIVEGACPTGADKFAHEWAVAHSGASSRVHYERWPANWRPNGQFNKAAGYQRNVKMVDTNPDLVLVYIRNNSKGASHTMTIAQTRGIECRVYRIED